MKIETKTIVAGLNHQSSDCNGTSVNLQNMEEKVEVIKKENGCMLANGILICYCGKCKSGSYPLPRDFKRLSNLH